MITKENIQFHELIGLKVEVIKSTSKPYKGIKGIIIDEKKNIFIIESNEKEKKVPKKGNVFQFQIRNEKIDVFGDTICYAPEDRLKKVKK